MRSPRRASVTPDVLDRVLRGEALPAEIGHYVSRVLRLRRGARLEVSDGSGRVAVGHLQRDGDDWRIEDVILEQTEDDTVPIVLCAGLLKPKRWRLLIEKCVELGVSTIIPVVAMHAAQRPKSGEISALVTRWRRIALEASKQCRRAMATRVEAPATLGEVLGRPATAVRLLADRDAPGGWPDGELTPCAHTTLLIGPEGGFTEDERRAAVEAGFTPVSLGRFTLRAETASIALVAMVRDRLGFAAGENEDASCR